MRFLHTADLHLGRQFNNISLEEDHDAVLDQILTALKAKAADALIIAGDIFDRPTPPAAAVSQFNTFLSKVASETNAAVIIIAGNHDSGDRLAAMSIMADTKRALIRGVVTANEIPLLLEDEFGMVAFSGLPFCYEYAARECFSDEGLATPEDVIRLQVASARRHIPEGTRWVIIAHAFVSGANNSNSERSLARVGGVETVNAGVFNGAHYVALGHLHRPQFIEGEHIRYSGSPLAFGFDEADHSKSVNLVEIDRDGEIAVETIPLKPVRGIRVVKGKHAELLLTEPSSDFIKVVLTDDHPVIDGMKRLRAVFPNACDLIYARDEQAPETKSLDQRATRLSDPIEVARNFLKFVRDGEMSQRENEIVTQALHDVQNREGLE